MPFIAQCPHADCRKYQLLEDALRGAVTHCLLCKQSLRVTDGAGGPKAEAVAAPPVSTAPPVTTSPPPRAGVARCPKCAVELKLPWEKPVRSVRCPKCGEVFSP